MSKRRPIAALRRDDPQRSGAASPRSATQWRDVPDGPRSLIAALSGPLTVHCLNAAQSARLAQPLPQLRTALEVRNKPDALALALGVRMEGSGLAADEIVDKLCTVGETGRCDVLRLVNPSANAGQLVGLALRRNARSSFKELSLVVKCMYAESNEFNEAVLQVLRGMHGNSTLERLKLSRTSRFNPFNAAGVCAEAMGTELAAALERCQLRKLEVNLDIRDGAGKPLVGGLAQLRTLRELRLGGFSEDGAALLAAALGGVLHANPHLHALELAACDFSRATTDTALASALAAAIAPAPGLPDQGRGRGRGRGRALLHTLELFDCTVGAKACHAIREALAGERCTLREAMLGGNVLLAGGGGAVLARGLASNQTLRELGLWSSGLDQAAGEALGAALASSGSALRVLNVGRNRKLGDAGVAALATGLASNGTLRSLNVRCCGLGIASCEALGVALAYAGSALHRLDVHENSNIGDAGGAALAKGLADNRTLRKIFLRECNLGSAACEALALAFTKGLQLEKLDLCGNGAAGDVGGAALAHSLIANRGIGAPPPLRQLNLCRCDVGRATCDKLGAGLASGGALQLQQLLLSWATSEAARGCALPVARGLQANAVLRELRLEGCHIDATVCEALAGALAFGGTALRSLSLTHCSSLGDIEGVALVSGLKTNCTLEDLVLRDCNVGLATCQALGAVLGQQPGGGSLRKLVLSENGAIGDAGGVALATGLASNSSLRKLRLRACSVGEATCEALGQALAVDSSALEELLLDQNGVGVGNAGGQAIARALKRNCNLRKLGLRDCRVDKTVQDQIALAAKHPAFQCSCGQLS